VQQEYERKGEDFTELFQVILSVTEEVGIDEALKYLEECVAEKRLWWLSQNLETLGRIGNPVVDAMPLLKEEFDLVLADLVLGLRPSLVLSLAINCLWSSEVL
jgi:hypothetical protein